MILDPGTFDVKLYRKNIPVAVKIACLLRYFRKFLELGPGVVRDLTGVPANQIQFDHRPPLCDRPYDTEAGDFIPPQWDPSKIEPVVKGAHDERTFGRKEGAEKTVTTRGSDVGERARSSDIRATKAVHDARLALKAGRQDRADEILAGARFKKKHLRPKRKIPQPKNPWGTGKRKMGMGAKHESGDRRDSTRAGQSTAARRHHTGTRTYA